MHLGEHLDPCIMIWISDRYLSMHEKSSKCSGKNGINKYTETRETDAANTSF